VSGSGKTARFASHLVPGYCQTATSTMPIWSGEHSVGVLADVVSALPPLSSAGALRCYRQIVQDVDGESCSPECNLEYEHAWPSEQRGRVAFGLGWEWNLGVRGLGGTMSPQAPNLFVRTVVYYINSWIGTYGVYCIKFTL